MVSMEVKAEIGDKANMTSLADDELTRAVTLVKITLFWWFLEILIHY